MTADPTLWLPYAQMQTALPPLEVMTAQGSTLYLSDGRQLIDGVASWWTACHGYQHPTLIQAIQDQATTLCHVMLGGLVHPQAKRLAHRLAATLPGDLNHVFFSESGSVAVEIALKIALQYWINHKTPSRHRFIHFQHAYHGDTLFAMSVCDPIEGMHRLFHPILPVQDFHLLPTSDILLEAFEKWLSQHASKVAGIIIEPLVQGAGGMKMHSPDHFRQLCELCRRFDILIIADEIFTGFGRTGSHFAIEQADFIPDIICLSKALTGGTLPLAATVVRQNVFSAFLDPDFEKALMHGTTFMGNALACAAANASLDLFETQSRLQQVALIEKSLQSDLAPLLCCKEVKDVRVKGAIGAVQLNQPLSQSDLNWFKHGFIQEGIWCRPLGDIVYTTPPLTIDLEHLWSITRTMVKLVTAYSS